MNDRKIHGMERTWNEKLVLKNEGNERSENTRQGTNIERKIGTSSFSSSGTTTRENVYSFETI